MSAIGDTVEIEVEHRQWFQALDETVRIVVEDDALIQQTFRIEDRLQFLHRLVGILTPLVFHEGRHITTCSVLGLQ